MKITQKELHPRPQFYRTGAISLNGEWDFAFDNKNEGEGLKWSEGLTKKQKICVPFTYETIMSGIGKLEPCNAVWYSKKLNIENNKSDELTILHFEGSDYLTKVWVNGKYIGQNTGAYHRFSFDITSTLVSGSNLVVVKCEDSLDARQIRGKQRWYDGKAWGCFYNQSTGIWKDVWIEKVSPLHLDTVKIIPDIQNSTVRFDMELSALSIGCEVEALITYDGKLVAKSRYSVIRPNFSVVIDITSEACHWKVAEWTPENPCLYDVTFTVLKDNERVDIVESYFGMREFKAYKNNLLLNRIPYYQKLILDQGYWHQSGITPPSPDSLKKDIEFVKRMGFNGVRKHQKIEDERFLYWADKLGLIVWCEMPSAYEYSERTILQYTEQWQKIVKQSYNHPSVCVWVVFNESWGVQRIFDNASQQNFTKAAYHLTKAYDTMRPVISNDGWEHTKSDIIGLHNYEESGEKLAEQYKDIEAKALSNQNPTHVQKQSFAVGHEYEQQPIIISEYGGIAFKSSTEKEGDWGYGNLVTNEESFLKRMQSVTDAIKNIPNVCGYCYTQLTDVEQEVNGLLTVDREPKIPLDKIEIINKK